MKVRVGLGLGPVGPEVDLAALVDQLERDGVDSLWLSEVVQAPQLDPVVAMAYVVARTRRMKVGTGVMVLPGRHPVLVAKQLASLDRLAPRRILPVFGVQAARAAERAAFPVDGAARGEVFDEALLVLRRLLTEPTVTHRGRFFPVTEASVGFLPAKPLDIWLGGSAPAALRRIGRLADGWLASFVTPADAAAGIALIRDEAARAGRAVDEEHYGVSLAVALDGELPPGLVKLARDRHPDADLAALVPTGWDSARDLILRFVEAGVSKFVVRPATPPASWPDFATAFADRMLPLQT